MTEMVYLAAGLLYAALAVFAYRMGLRDGMQKERGIAPLQPPQKRRKPTAEEAERQALARAVEKFH